LSCTTRANAPAAGLAVPTPPRADVGVASALPLPLMIDRFASSVRRVRNGWPALFL
jgi:hypothetical protein